jgi:undecaprenyl-diphosphatase
MRAMDALIVAVAQYALFVVAAGALVAWALVDRSEKLALAVQAVLTVALVAVLVKVAGLVHTDPRPFVVNPSVKPLFPHPADNGFPSDHTALAAGVSVLVARYRGGIGYVLLAVTVAIGASRVAAHVHHTQDIVAGLLLGGLAAVVALLLWRGWLLVRQRTSRAAAETGVQQENSAG